jgi:hypothetical protein
MTMVLGIAIASSAAAGACLFLLKPASLISQCRFRAFPSRSWRLASCSTRRTSAERAATLGSRACFEHAPPAGAGIIELLECDLDRALCGA